MKSCSSDNVQRNGGASENKIVLSDFVFHRRQANLDTNVVNLAVAVIAVIFFAEAKSDITPYGVVM